MSVMLLDAYDYVRFMLSYHPKDTSYLNTNTDPTKPRIA